MSQSLQLSHRQNKRWTEEIVANNCKGRKFFIVGTVRNGNPNIDMIVLTSFTDQLLLWYYLLAVVEAISHPDFV